MDGVDIKGGIMREAKRHLPYIKDRVTLSAGKEDFCYVQDDEEQGLGDPGRSLFMKNTGSATIKYQIFDGNAWSPEITLDPSEYDSYDVKDRIKAHTVRIVGNLTASSEYSLKSCAATGDEVNEAW